jgi:hypothetical protein
MRILLAAGVLAAALPAAGQAATSFLPGQSAAWFSQIHLTPSLQAQALNGRGVLIGFVDTGIVARNSEFTGRVSPASRCAALTFTCSNGVYDDNGHGTSTAAIAAGAYSPSVTFSMSGVAPMASIVAEKVLDASGSGMTTDVANGVTKAVNAGARVINLSLTYAPTGDIVSAINYAASKGAIVVFAGGNSSSALNGGADTTGLSPVALSHLVFVGSVDSKNALSSFSNTPGAGAVRTPAVRASYASLWLMAPGENVVAPGVQYGAKAYAYWSGTSMAAPMVAGALALLEARWPVLARNGTATQVLFASADDLGDPGVDQVYGHGLLDLARAFQPIGALSVVQPSGSSLTVTSATAVKITSGALGSLPAVRAVLSNYTTFDTFSRDFKVDLSGLVGTPDPGAGSVASTVSAPIVQASARLHGGQMLMAETSDAQGLASAVSGRATGPRSQAWGSPAVSLAYLAFRSDGDVMAAVGRGMTSSFSFAQALWGPDAPAADQAGRLGVSGALLDLAQGGDFAAVGAPLGQRVRLAFDWSGSPRAYQPGPFQSNLGPTSTAMAAGVAARLTSRWTVGATYSSLIETQGLLGAAYGPGSLLDLGARHHSRALAFSSSYDLGGGLSLMADAVRTQTDGAELEGGLIKSVSPLKARAWGVSLVKSNAFLDDDGLSLSFREPLRVVAGEARMAITSVDSEGYPTTTLTAVSLRPSGVERDVYLGYHARLPYGVDLNTAFGYRTQVQNTRGLDDVAVRMALGARF